MKKLKWFMGKYFFMWGLRILTPAPKKYNYSGNRDIETINKLAIAVYQASGRKPITAVLGVLLRDGPGRNYVSCAYPKDKNLALNILTEIEKQITGRTICARD